MHTRYIDKFCFVCFLTEHLSIRVPQSNNVYYLQKKNLPAHSEQVLFNDSSNFKKIGDQIEALQISELVVQTASL